MKKTKREIFKDDFLNFIVDHEWESQFYDDRVPIPKTIVELICEYFGAHIPTKYKRTTDPELKRLRKELEEALKFRRTFYDSDLGCSFDDY